MDDALGCIRPPLHSNSVVFIHGINSSSATAWQPEAGKLSWPKLLEADTDLQDLGIYTFDYPSDLRSGNYGV